MNKIDIEFDYRQDSKCGDPDADSKKMYDVHYILWNKILPCGKDFDMKIGGTKSRILIENNLCDNLSSDRMCPHYDERYGCNIDDWVTEEEKEEFKRKVRTIGGHILFPAHQKNGQTVNQVRGINKKICDRFDLTLECIRRYYINEPSVLFDTLIRYKDFFDLFVNFKGYVDFFLLQDFVDEKQQVRFSLPFDNFKRSPVPQNIDEYTFYRTHTIDLINSRNKRIIESLKTFTTQIKRTKKS